MSAQLLRGNWNQLQGILKQKYGQLTDDLKYVEGKGTRIIGQDSKETGTYQRCYGPDD